MVYFERTRAGMCVFKYANRREEHHFEVDERRRTIEIRQHWLRKGPLLYRGTYDAHANRIELRGATRLILVRAGV